MAEPLQWYDENAADNSTWIDALAELRQRAIHVKATAINTSRQLLSRSISTPRRR
jgi:hypothetical protein